MGFILERTVLGDFPSRKGLLKRCISGGNVSPEGASRGIPLGRDTWYSLYEGPPKGISCKGNSPRDFFSKGAKGFPLESVSSGPFRRDLVKSSPFRRDSLKEIFFQTRPEAFPLRMDFLHGFPFRRDLPKRAPFARHASARYSFTMELLVEFPFRERLPAGIHQWGDPFTKKLLKAFHFGMTFWKRF